MKEDQGKESSSKGRKKRGQGNALQERKEKMPVLAWALEGPVVEVSLSREFRLIKSTDVKLSFMGVDVDASRRE